MTDTLIHDLVDISQSPAALIAQADLVLERAKWAAEVFQRYDRDRTYAIAEAVAQEAHEKAAIYAEWAVRETGFGVAEHKKLKNELTSLPFLEYYRDWDFITPHCDPDKRVVEIPRPAGVIFALIPSTNPISTLNFKILCALLTRNAIVLSPHPAARECCVDAARHLAAAAEQVGAPDGIVQVVEKPNDSVDRSVHAVRENRCYPGDRRNRNGPLGLFVFESCYRRWTRKRTCICRQHRRYWFGRQAHYGQQII